MPATQERCLRHPVYVKAGEPGTCYHVSHVCRWCLGCSISSEDVFLIHKEKYGHDGWYINVFSVTPS